ncbi:matrin 3-like 1.2 isoform X2 [Syngnathus typhle]|uniref:matrin 3-like 1.2 isoform X2 n=1 Tax=Syngnathus typhle TaxID=161592 RepID=UPI002A6A2F60|nr:matrin 3-like 1.2 isoform X2 [Syngnathus typhle]
MDGASKGFAPGRGRLAAAAESLSFSMSEQRPLRQMGGSASDNQDGGSLMPCGGGPLGGTMKLFASLGLSPSDLDVLAQIPEKDISVETLPQILLQLKNRKAARGPSSSGWDDGGRMRGGAASSFGHGSGSSDFGFASVSHGTGLNFGGGNREPSYAELLHRDSFSGQQGASLSQGAFPLRRKGSPSLGKVQDFLGAPPPRFPHVCSLCDFDVHSNMEWTQHTNGLRHAENRRVLLNMYPEWDLSGAPSRSPIMESTNLSAGLLGPAPSGPGPAARMQSSWGSGPSPGLGMSRQNRSEPDVLRSRVVVVKYDRKPLSNKTLFSFAEPFGRLQEHLVLKTKAFLELETHEEAMAMVNYYQQNSAMLYGKPITFYLSRRLVVIQKEDRASDRAPWDAPHRGSQVVFFSNLPREEDKKKELLTVAARFGVVEKHLFLTDQGFIQLGRPEDAEMMVKYYTVNPLTIKGRAVRLNICTKYKTLNVNRRPKESGSNWKADNKRRSSPPRSPSSSRDDENKSASEGEADDEVAAGVREGEAEDEGEEHPSATGADEEEKVSEEEEKEPEGGDLGVHHKAPDDHADSVAMDADLKGDDVTGETPADAGGAAQLGDESKEWLTEAESHLEQATGEDEDFLENMEDFVTLDELPDEDEKEAADEDESDDIDPSRKGGLRVVNIQGFRRGYKFLDELLGLATPFGKVVKHLVLDWRPEAFLQFSSEEEARAMVKFYNGNVMASVCGRPVRVNHSLTYPTIQSGKGRVVYVGQLPNGKYEDEDVLKLAEPFGKVKKYFLNPIKRECFLEMEKAEAADEMAEAYKTNQPKLNGRRLLVYVSRKYTQLKYGHSCPSTTKRAISGSSSKSSEEPPAKRIKEKEERKEEMKKSKDHDEETPKDLEPQEEQEQPKSQEEITRKEEEEEEEAAATDEPEVDKPEADKPEADKPEAELEEEQTIPQEDKPEADKAEAELEEEQKKPQEDEQMEPQEEEAALSSPVKMEVAIPEKIPDVPVCQEPTEEPLADQNKAGPPPLVESKPAAALPLPPYDPDKAIGVEHIKMGYYCRVCLLFYSNEDVAKKTHCSSQMHYDKLQKHLEKERSKTEKKRAKKPSA